MAGFRVILAFVAGDGVEFGDAGGAEEAGGGEDGGLADGEGGFEGFEVGVVVGAGPGGLCN